MIQHAPTIDELKDAYKCAELRRIGVSYQKAIMTDSIRIALRLTAISLRNKLAVNPPGGINQ